MEIETFIINVAGRRTRYLEAGAGAPLVLLHGNGDSAVGWRPAMQALGKHYRVYAPDLPGFGMSEPPADYAPSAYARFVADFLDAVAVPQAAVAGSSFGGQVALHLALEAPERVTALALVNSAALGYLIYLGWPPPVLPGVGELLVAWNKTPLGAAQRAGLRVATLLTRPYRAPADWLIDQYRAARRPGVMESELAVLRTQADLLGQREVLLDILPRVRVPTLVLWGALDRVVPVEQARAAVERLPRGELVVLPDCGHLPFVEQPARFAAVLHEFLSRTAAEHNAALALVSG